MGGFDLRSLALLRIVACSVYLVELLGQWKYLEAYCSDNGLIPRRALFESGEGGWSVYLATGSLEGVQFIFVLHLAAVVALILGWKTRWSSFFCYIFAYSIQHRFPALPGWETEIRLMFLIGMVLPWSHYFSLDSRNSPPPPNAPTWVANPATLAWKLQVVIVYFASGLLKVGPGWAEGTAVEVSLASDAYSNSFGLWLLGNLKHYPNSLVVLNYSVPLLELFSPLLLLCPWPNLQMAWALVLIAMHLVFGLTLHIGAFSFICSACLLSFLSNSFWNKLLKSKLDNPAQTQTLPKLSATIGEAAVLGWISLSMLVSTLDNFPEFKGFVQPAARAPWVALGLEQTWGMFVPPPFEGGWHVIKGQTLEGRWVDLLENDGRPASEERPEWVYASYPGVRGYLFFASYLRAAEGRQDVRQATADYYRRRWENRNPGSSQRISKVEIVFFYRKYSAGQGFGPTKRILIHSQDY